MRVNYSPKPWYFCCHLKQSVNGDYCPSHPTGPVDQGVLQAFFEAVSPAQINALEEVLKKKKEDKQRLNKHWQGVLKRAEYEVQLAEERYEAVDARNRLVAETLESRWEESLLKVSRLRDKYQAFNSMQDPEYHLPDELRKKMQNIATSLPQLWSEGKISMVRMKELLRCLIDKVVLKKLEADKIDVRIVWISGAYWPLTITKTIHKFSDSPSYKNVVARIRQLWPSMSDTRLAKLLTTEGFRSPRSNIFLPITVQDIRLSRGWRRTLPGRKVTIAPNGYLKCKELALKMDVTPITIYRWVRKGVIPQKYIQAKAGAYFFKDCEQLFKFINRRNRYRES